MDAKKNLLRQQRAKFKSAFANVMEIPKDIALDLPRITMIGNLQMIIENHKGIVEYSENKIRVLVTRGQLEIEGKNMALRTIQLDEIIIDGEVYHIKVDITS